MGHGVAEHRDLQVPDVRVQRRVEDALLGGLAAEHHMPDALLLEQVLQRVW